MDPWPGEPPDAPAPVKRKQVGMAHALEPWNRGHSRTVREPWRPDESVGSKPGVTAGFSPRIL